MNAGIEAAAGIGCLFDSKEDIMIPKIVRLIWLTGYCLMLMHFVRKYF